MFCPYCGLRLEEETNNFCPHCGKRLIHATGPLFPAPQPFIDPDDSAAMEAVVKAGVIAAPPPFEPVPPVAPPTMPMPVCAEPAPVQPLRARRAMDGPAAVLTALGCLLVVGALALVALAPLVSLPFAADLASPLTAAVAEVDPALAVSLNSGGGGDALTLAQLTAVALAYADTLGTGPQAVGAAAVTGVALGCAAVAALLTVVGALVSLVRRRPAGLLLAGAVFAFVLVLAGTVAVCAGDLLFTADLRAAATALFAGSGPQVTIPAHGLLPTPFLLGALGAALVALVLVAVARRRWGTEHPYVS